jgi:hypothetical protein
MDLIRDDRLSKEFALAEYSQLRHEQTERIKSRDTFVNLTIVAIGALVAFGMDKKEPITFLAIPWISICFGWTFLVNDLKIARIGQYLNIVSASQDLDESWDQWRLKARMSYLESPFVGCLVQHIVFVVPAVIACIAYPARRQVDIRALQDWEVGLLAFGWLAIAATSAALVATALARMRKQ